MNIYTALIVAEKAGWAHRQSESYSESADTIVSMIGAALEGLTEDQLTAALRYAFDDDRPDMKLRAMAFLGTLLGQLTNQAAELRLATPEVWPTVLPQPPTIKPR